MLTLIFYKLKAAYAMQCIFVMMVFGYMSLATAAITGKDLMTGKNRVVQPGKKGSVIVFMSARCPCSNSHLQIIKNLSEKFKDFSFAIINSNTDESLDEAQKYFKGAGLQFALIRDEKARLADQFKAYKTPHAFVLSADEKVLYKGGVTDSATGENAVKNYLQDALSDVEAGQVVRMAEGRTLGCVISRGENVL
jgi:peroxiredoxin